MTYEPKTYRTSGGDKIVIASGGELELQSGGTFDMQADVALTDDVALVLGTGSDIDISWATASTDRLKIVPAANNTRADLGTAAKSLDLYVYGSAGTIVFDASADTIDLNAVDLNLQDDDLLAFGDGNDVTIDWDTSSTDMLKVVAAANNTRIDVGTAAKSFDVHLFGSAGTIVFDASADTVDFNAVDLNLQDDDLLAFGDANDVTVDWDTSSTDMLKMLPAANNTRWNIGAAATSFDVYLYGSAGTIDFDASADTLDVDAVKLDLNNSTSSFQLYLSAAANTSNVGPGGLRCYTNSTGAMLSLNTTGTTWVDVQLS